MFKTLGSSSLASGAITQSFSSTDPSPGGDGGSTNGGNDSSGGGNNDGNNSSNGGSDGGDGSSGGDGEGSKEATKGSKKLVAGLKKAKKHLTGVYNIAQRVAQTLLSVASAFAAVSSKAVMAMGKAGLQRKAEQLAATSSQFKNSAEAMQAIKGEINDAISKAKEPLRTQANTKFAIKGVERYVELVHLASEGLNQMGDTIRPVVMKLSSSVLKTAPAVFDELDKTVQKLAPAFLQLQGVISDAPKLVAWFREQLVRVLPELTNIGDNAVRAASGIIAIGVNLADLLIPALGVVFDLVGWLTGLFGDLSKPMFAAATAAIVGAIAFSALGASEIFTTVATQGLIAALLALTSPISATAILIGALIGAVVGIITYFDLWDDIVAGLTATWNAFIGFLDLYYGTLVAIIKIIGKVIWSLLNMDEVVRVLSDLFRWFSEFVDDVISGILDFASTAATAVQELVDLLVETANTIPGIDIGDISVERSVGFEALKVDNSNKKSESKPDKPPKQEKYVSNYDFSGADFGGKSQTDVERTVAEAVRKANRRSRAREDAHLL